MSTKQSTIDYLRDQLVSLPDITFRKMFGEFAMYCEWKVVALICDEKLFVKITEPGKKFVDKYFIEGFAYQGAKASMRIDEDRIEDREWLSTLIQITADALPFPKPKKYVKIIKKNKS